MQKTANLKIFWKKVGEIVGGSKKSATFATANENKGLFTRAEIKLGYGVIGNTTDSGPVIIGSSPIIPTQSIHIKRGCFFYVFTFAPRNTVC